MIINKIMKTFKQYFIENNLINLWLDDERDPTDPVIKEKFGSKGNEIWVKTPEEAINLLKTGDVVSISFDHDLSLPEPENGYKVAKWIEEKAFKQEIPKLNWKVHSANPTGSRNITLAMQNADKFWSR